jgi:hypothetical protein
MATKNFTNFSLTQPTTSDYIVGYNANATQEIRTTIQSILDLKNIPSQLQVLFYNENSKNLTISNANTISLSSLYTDTTNLSSVSGSFATLEVRNGNIIFSNLPTLSANLPTGSLWNNNGFLRIV